MDKISSQASILNVQKITRRFSGLVAVNDVSFSIQSGEIFGLIGPNGAGKTTLFNMITGLIPPWLPPIAPARFAVTARPALAGVLWAVRLAKPCQSCELKRPLLERCVQTPRLADPVWLLRGHEPARQFHRNSINARSPQRSEAFANSQSRENAKN